MMRCMKFQNNKKLLNIKEGAENITGDRISQKNDNSPNICRDHEVLSHSTPIRSNNNSSNIEEFSDIDYGPSPILLPCTQEGGNEVAWDWQNSLSKTPNSKNRKQDIHCETPKGTKLLQRKRNSNSPLLYKPLKRKTIKMENIENIGQFAAELQALNEKMKIIKQNDQNNLCDRVEDMPIVISDHEKIENVKNNEQNCTKKIDSNKDTDKTHMTYDDLFDDSIDDSMARCTQEIEEKFNLIAVKGDSITQSNIKKENIIDAINTIDQYAFLYPTFNEKSEKTLARGICENKNNNSMLKTYSKLTVKKNASLNIQLDLHKSYLTNNNTIHNEKPCSDKKLSKTNTIGLFDIPDDSFDDCLATCVEDEKLSMLIESNDSSYKHLTHAPLKEKYNSICEVKPVSSLTVKSTAKLETSSISFLENRKFFKTKSLSDQYIGQDIITNAKSTASTSYYTAKSMSHTNVRAFVSTNPTATNNCHKIEDSAISLMRNAGRTHGSNVNRSTVKEGGDRFIRYNSTGSMKVNTMKTTKSGLQPTRCTAEEIEKKRLQAKMRLEAKKKLSMKVTNNINR